MRAHANKLELVKLQQERGCLTPLGGLRETGCCPGEAVLGCAGTAEGPPAHSVRPPNSLRFKATLESERRLMAWAMVLPREVSAVDPGTRTAAVE